MFLGINSIYTPVYLPLCEYGQNQPPCADVGLLLNMARTWLRSNIMTFSHLFCIIADFTSPSPLSVKSVMMYCVGW